jgi:hypothetical protein
VKIVGRWYVPWHAADASLLLASWPLCEGLRQLWAVPAPACCCRALVAAPTAVAALSDGCRGAPVATSGRSDCRCAVCVMQAAGGTLESYLSCVRSTLEAALCLRNFPSQNVERHNKPEVEMGCVACVTAA